MSRVLAISSQVVRGHVGLSAIVPALQRLGHEVVALPTILLSNHPGHPHATGERISPDLLRRMVGALDQNGWLADVDAILTGYLPTAGHVQAVEDIIARVKPAAPRAIYLCDAVMGDWPKGLYIAPDAADAVRQMLVPRADIVKGNAFEIGFLSGLPVAKPEDVAAAAMRIGRPAVLAASVDDGMEAKLANVLARPGAAPVSVAVGERQGVPKGTGDLLAGLLIGYALRHGEAGLNDALRAAVSATGRVIARSLGRSELDLVGALPLIDPQIAV